ncbi:MAG: antitoxin family protein [Armatimonadota bacterium]|nr:antitoxin family protein [bacterium]MDW8321203.1 antitoxin family protein [Armatimonadota bacterium]
MTQTVDAIYENGVLRPVQPLSGIRERSRVRVTIEVRDSSTHPLADCVGILPDGEAQEMRQIIEEEFEKVNPDEWQ